MARAFVIAVTAVALALAAAPSSAQQQYHTRPFGSGTITTGR